MNKQNRTCLTAAGSAEPERAGTGTHGGVDGVPAGRRLTGGGVRVCALSVRLALVFIHAQRRHGELLSANKQTNINTINATKIKYIYIYFFYVLVRTHSRSTVAGSPLFPPPVSRVPESFGKGVVVDLQLRDLSTEQGGFQRRQTTVTAHSARRARRQTALLH